MTENDSILIKGKNNKRQSLQSLINMGLEEIINDLERIIPDLRKNPTFCPLEGVCLLYELIFFTLWKSREKIDVTVSHFLGTLLPLRNKLIQLPHKHKQTMRQSNFLTPKKPILEKIFNLFGFTSTLLFNQKHFLEDIKIFKKEIDGNTIVTLEIDSTNWENYDYQQSRIYEGYNKLYPPLKLPLERAKYFFNSIEKNDFIGLINFALDSKKQIDEIFDDILDELIILKNHKRIDKYLTWISFYQLIYHLSNLYYFYSLEKGIIRIPRLNKEKLFDLYCNYFSITTNKPDINFFEELYQKLNINWYLSYFPIVKCEEKWIIIPSLFISTTTMTMENLLHMIYEDAREIGSFLEEKTAKFLKLAEYKMIDVKEIENFLKECLEKPVDIDLSAIITKDLYLCQCKSISARNRKTYNTRIREGRDQIFIAINWIKNKKEVFKKRFNVEFNNVHGLIITLNSFPIRTSQKREGINILTYKELENLFRQLSPDQTLAMLIQKKKDSDKEKWKKKGVSDPSMELDGVYVEFNYILPS
jgi:hypothetical protein